MLEDSLFNLEGAGDEVCGRAKIAWGYSSAGRAPALQAGGRRFDPDYLHQRASEDENDDRRQKLTWACSSGG